MLRNTLYKLFLYNSYSHNCDYFLQKGVFGSAKPLSARVKVRQQGIKFDVIFVK